MDSDPVEHWNVSWDPGEFRISRGGITGQDPTEDKENHPVAKYIPSRDTRGRFTPARTNRRRL